MPLDLNKLGPVNYASTNQHPFIVLKKQTVLGGKVLLDKDLYKNIDMHY